jgi:hypothetical protein
MMAWTAPALGSEFAVAEVVTAAKMNAKLTDNLRYLKGLDGAVVIQDNLLIQKASGSSSLGLQIPTNTTFGQFIFNDQAGAQASYLGYIGSAAGLGARNDTVEIGTVAKDLTFRAGAGGASEYMRLLTASGNLGIGTASPQGRVHAKGAIASAMLFEYDGVDGTARTVIADGAGDVLYSIVGMFTVRASDGGLSSRQCHRQPGALQRHRSVQPRRRGYERVPPPDRRQWQCHGAAHGRRADL